MGARDDIGLFSDQESKAALDAMFERAWSGIAPPPTLSIIEWAEKYREMSSEETAKPGRYDMDATPALRGVLSAIDNPLVRKVICQKSAQVGYTAGIACNVIGFYIHWRPSTIVAMFPREKSGKDFAAEKLEPMIRATPALSSRVNLKSRAAGNGTMRRRFPGGLLKLVGSNSPSDVKSTSARVGICEEPDDANQNVAGQGNSITLLAERVKTYAPDEIQLIGGTPTAKETSLIVKEMRSTDQRHFMVGCHDCGERHAFNWDNVTIPGFKLSDEDLAKPPAELNALYPEREVYGRARWEDAYYSCPHCGSVWTDEERIANIRRAARVPPLYGWEPTAQSSTPGFFMNELMSVFDGSRVPELAKKFLVAHAEMEAGDPNKMIGFWNSTLGLPWEFRGDLPEEDELRARAMDYDEWTSPAGGLDAIMSVDVQHDRLAVTVWTVGRGEEMWLCYWGEIYGRTTVAHEGAWVELAEMMKRTVRRQGGGSELTIQAVGIDSGDGQTSESVYSFVRKHNGRGGQYVLATKGASDKVGKVEIWTKPKPIDPGKKQTVATKMGVRVHTIGAARTKDLVLGWSEKGGRVRLEGIGPGRMHWFKAVRPDWYEQLLSELKVPSPRNPLVREWKPRTDRRNEGLDCTVIAVWLCRFLKLHLRRPSQWATVEERLGGARAAAEPAPQATGQPMKPKKKPAGLRESPPPMPETAPQRAETPTEAPMVLDTDQEAHAASHAAPTPAFPAPEVQLPRKSAPKRRIRGRMGGGGASW